MQVSDESKHGLFSLAVLFLLATKNGEKPMGTRFKKPAKTLTDWQPLVGYKWVDGSEIRRSPVEVGSLSHDVPGLKTIPGGG